MSKHSIRTINPAVWQLLASSVVFGLGAIFVVVLPFDAVSIAFYRLFFGAFLFASILLYQRQSFAINPYALLFAVLAGAMLGLDLAWWNQSILFVGPGIATILNCLQVFFMAGFGWLIYRDALTWRLAFSLCASFIGVVLLCSNEITHTDTGSLGVLLGVISAVAFALSMLSLKQAAQYQKSGLINTMFYASVGGAVTTALYVWLTGRSFSTDTPMAWPAMVIYACVIHVLAWYLMARAIPKLNVAVVGLLVCLEPVVAIAVDISVFAKHLSLWQFIGIILTLGAVYIGSQSQKKTTQKNHS